MKYPAIIPVLVAIGCFMSGVFLAEYFSGEAQSPAPGKPEVLGARPPDFSLTDISGKLRNITEWRGKVLVLNFWASWCQPCREEIPGFIELQDKYADRGVQFLGIALEEVEAVRDFAGKLGINYPLLVGEQEIIKLANSLGNHIGGLPYTVIVNKQGIINFTKQGKLDFAEAEQLIVELL